MVVNRWPLDRVGRYYPDRSAWGEGSSRLKCHTYWQRFAPPGQTINYEYVGISEETMKGIKASTMGPGFAEFHFLHWWWSQDEGFCKRVAAKMDARLGF